MDKKVKSDWVAALRSGAFRKGSGQLHDLDDRYDATGVLCHLAYERDIVPRFAYRPPEAVNFFGYQYGDPDQNDRRATVLPEAVQDWSGVSHREGMKVALMGDNGKSFETIATWIEENL